jgi:hypothetical protein
MYKGKAARVTLQPISISRRLILQKAIFLFSMPLPVQSNLASAAKVGNTCYRGRSNFSTLYLYKLPRTYRGKFGVRKPRLQ